MRDGLSWTQRTILIAMVLLLTVTETMLPWKGLNSVWDAAWSVPLALTGLLFALRDPGAFRWQWGSAPVGFLLLPAAYFVTNILGMTPHMTWVILWGVAAGRALQAWGKDVVGDSSS